MRLRLNIKKCLVVSITIVVVNALLFLLGRLTEQDTENQKSLTANLVTVQIKQRGDANANRKRWTKEISSEHVMVFESPLEAHKYAKSVRLKDVEKIVIHYSNFTRRIPHFISTADRNLFLRSKRNRGNLIANDPELLRGEIEVIRNGTFQMSYQCGFRSESSYMRISRSPHQSYEILIPLIIPMAFLFQHFFDGTIPKIAQAYEFIGKPNVRILLEKPFHHNIYGLLERLKIKPDQVVWHNRDDEKTVYRADYMLTTCVTPPLHPLLWERARQILGVKDELPVPYAEATVMLLTRAGATIGGRNMLNQKEVESYLFQRYKGTFVVFKQYALAEAMEVFSRVKIIIGTHGGAFYNMNFSPLNTTVIEFAPVLSGGRDIRALPHAIFWAMADLLGQSYWRVPCLSANVNHDMNIDIDKLNAILDKVDGTSTHTYSIRTRRTPGADRSIR